MGSSQHKDPHLDIYLQTYQQILSSGQYLEGSVHINSMASNPYSKLYLRLECNQSVHWVEQKGDDRNHFRNNNKSYEQVLLLYQFQDQMIPQGHYSFPFKMLLPQGLPGSLIYDLQNFIRYSLTAQLIPNKLSKPKLNVEPQKYEVFFNILESLHRPFGSIDKEKNNYPKCCGCCADYGIVNVSLHCDSNLIKSGDHFYVQALIDNTKGKKQIQQVSINLNEYLSRVSLMGYSKRIQTNSFVLYKLQKIIEAGRKQIIQFEKQVPFTQKSTVVGNTICNNYTLTIKSQMGCFSVGADCFLPITYHSSMPKILKNQKVNPPQGWKPHAFQKVAFNNLSLFDYSPELDFYQYNRDYTTKIAMGNNLQKLSANDYNDTNFQDYEITKKETLIKQV